VDKLQSSSLDKSALPTVLAYPEVFHLDLVPEIVGQFCYQVKGYPLAGIAVMLRVDGGGTYIRIGDWDGRQVGVDLKVYQLRFMTEYAHLFVHLMQVAKIRQIELYIACDKKAMTLVDVRTAMDRLASPGYIHDVFGKIMPSQETIGQPIVVTPEIVASLRQSHEQVVLKPSLFKTMVRDNIIHPLYARNWR
jgi:hypothetical protein